MMEEDQFEDQIDELKKFIYKQNKDVHDNNITINDLLNQIAEKQKKIDETANKKFTDLDNCQSRVTEMITNGI